MNVLFKVHAIITYSLAIWSTLSKFLYILGKPVLKYLKMILLLIVLNFDLISVTSTMITCAPCPSVPKLYDELGCVGILDDTGCCFERLVLILFIFKVIKDSVSIDLIVVIWTHWMRQNVISEEKRTKIENMLCLMICHIVNRRAAVVQDLYFLVLIVQFLNVQVCGGNLHTVIALKCTLLIDVVLLLLVVTRFSN